MPRSGHYSNHHSGEMPERLNGPVSKTGVGQLYRGSNPPLSATFLALTFPSITPLASGITPALGYHHHHRPGFSVESR